MIIALHVEHPGERAACIRPYSEDIEVNIRNLPEESEKEMTEELRTFFAEWYDGAKVYTKAEWDQIIEEDRKEAERCRRL